jgi:CheY-like chemotaxis protein
LASKGYEVITAYDGEEGLQKAKEHVPDLIISDILMPKMDGSAMADSLKYDNRTQNIPIIFLTCLVEGQEVAHSQSMIGGNLFVAKPFGIDELQDMVDKVLK